MLILGAIADLLLVVLLIAVSGFVFGSGPEGAHGDPSGVAMWGAGVLVCLAAPIAGFVLRAFGRAGTGVLVAWLPLIAALLVTAGVIPGV
jgi:hypothetical protein